MILMIWVNLDWFKASAGITVKALSFQYSLIIG